MFYFLVDKIHVPNFGSWDGILAFLSLFVLLEFEPLLNPIFQSEDLHAIRQHQVISVEARRQSRLLLMDIDARFELSLTSDTGPTPSIFSLAWKMRQDYANALIQCKKSAEEADIEGLTPDTSGEITDWFKKYFFSLFIGYILSLNPAYYQVFCF